MIRVEDLVGPHERDEFLRLAQVDDVVGVSGEHVDGLDSVAVDFKLEDFVRADFALLDQAVTGDDDEELPLGVVPVPALRDSWFGNFQLTRI